MKFGCSHSTFSLIKVNVWFWLLLLLLFIFSDNNTFSEQIYIFFICQIFIPNENVRFFKNYGKFHKIIGIFHALFSSISSTNLLCGAKLLTELYKFLLTVSLLDNSKSWVSYNGEKSKFYFLAAMESDFFLFL